MVAMVGYNDIEKIFGALEVGGGQNCGGKKGDGIAKIWRTRGGQPRNIANIWRAQVGSAEILGGRKHFGGKKRV